MPKAEIRTSKRELKKWFRANQKWFESNPNALRAMLDHPSFLTDVQRAMNGNKGRLVRRLGRLSQNTRQSPGGKGLISRLKFPSIDVLSERVSKATDLIDTFKALSGMMKK